MDRIQRIKEELNDLFKNKLDDNNIFYEYIGNTQENYFEIEDELKINNKELFKINNEWFNKY